jgi:hypothetical protein
MQITISSNSIIIDGNIKTVHDYQEIKSVTDSLIQEHKKIKIIIKDSLSITSSIIGYFNKIVLRDSIDLNMEVGNIQLVNLLDDLNLTSIFKVKKV